MGRQVIIELPYENDLAMHLVDVKPGDGQSIIEQINWLKSSSYTDTSEELREVMVGAIALFQLGAGSFEDCFAQSVVWMRG